MLACLTVHFIFITFMIILELYHVIQSCGSRLGASLDMLSSLQPMQCFLRSVGPALMLQACVACIRYQEWIALYV